jgi:hypothetical protein
MLKLSRRAGARVSVFLLMLALILTPGLGGRRAPAGIAGSVALADASDQRTYVQFIDGAYYGALGHFPTCEEEQAEYDALAGAAAAGNDALLAEARRFVSTLFETQASYDDPGGSYCQTPEYEARNPAYCNPFINQRSDSFITDLYGGFLLRLPDQPGFNDWMNTIPTYGRKVVLNGFRDSTEFGIIVNALIPGTRPTCTVVCPDCGTDPCPGPNTTKPNKLCQ